MGSIHVLKKWFLVEILKIIFFARLAVGWPDIHIHIHIHTYLHSYIYIYVPILLLMYIYTAISNIMYKTIYSYIYVVGARWLETPPPREFGVSGHLAPGCAATWNPVSGHPAPGWSRPETPHRGRGGVSSHPAPPAYIYIYIYIWNIKRIYEEYP